MPDQQWNSALWINRHQFCHHVPQGCTKHPQGTFPQQIHEHSYNLMAHINNGNLFSCCGTAAGGIIATVQQTTPAGQCMECNPQEGAREQKPEPGLEVTLRSSPSRTEMESYCPQKLFPPLGHHAIDFYAQKKQLLCNSLFIFYCTQEEEKSSFQKWLFKIYIQEKNCAVATQELNKHHTVTPMDGLHFSFTSQHRKTYFSSSWLFNPSFCSKWIRLGFNQFLFGPNSFRHTGKFNIEQNTEVKRSNNTSKELFPLCQQHSAADPSKYERLNEEG